MEDRSKELISFWRKLSRFLDTGIPLLRALEVIQRETSGEGLKRVLQAVASDIRAGDTMSESIAKHPSWFPASVQTFVEVGEATGALEKTTLQIAEALKDGTFKIEEESVTAGGDLRTHGTVAAAEDEASATLVANIIEDAFVSRASDIHFEHARDGLRVRCRIDGVLHEKGELLTGDQEKVVIARIKIMAGMNIAEKRLPQDGRIFMTLRGHDLHLRVSIVPYMTGESAVLRIFDRGSRIFSLTDQGFTEDGLAKVRGWTKRRNGLVIVAGPTGCGKTTTLYSMVHEANSPEVKITTVEDPVEYLIDGVNQQQINPSIGLTFGTTIRVHLRQDPDIVMVGSIRDLDTAQVIMQLSLSGHLALTTLHARDAAETVRRLLDIGVEPFLVNSTLTGVISQRLVRMICQNCKEEYEPDDWIKELCKDNRATPFFKGRGCDQCSGWGYRGRTAIHELLELDDQMKMLIAKDADLGDLRRQAIESGMTPVREDGLAKAKEGITTVEEVFRVTAEG
jgi:type II secretory ATPase GspE/PulE/Tfp pilus assembly ATPase PilB-like protein